MAPEVESQEEAGKKFEDGEKILAYHGPMMYQARVEKTEIKKGVWRYFIHYLGWSKKWDEWVDGDRLLKENPENLAKKKKLMESSAEKKRNRSSTGGSGQKDKQKGMQAEEEDVEIKPAALEEGNKRIKSESARDHHGDAANMVENVAHGDSVDYEQPAGASGQYSAVDQDNLVKIPIPPLLKKHLVEDWRSVTEEGKLLELPRNPTVHEVLENYMKSRSSSEAGVDQNAAEVADGLRAYFDRALPAILLYKQERQQYEDNFPEGSDKSPSDVYGAEHLLRLFIKLPELVSYIEMDDETLELLLLKLGELLGYLLEHRGAFFVRHFEEPEEELESRPDQGGQIGKLEEVDKVDPTLKEEEGDNCAQLGGQSEEKAEGTVDPE